MLQHCLLEQKMQFKKITERSEMLFAFAVPVVSLRDPKDISRPLSGRQEGNIWHWSGELLWALLITHLDNLCAVGPS